MKRIIILLEIIFFLSSKMPKNYDSKLWCNTCQAICEELLLIVKDWTSESVIDEALDGFCKYDRFSHYEFPPPKMFKGC